MAELHGRALLFRLGGLGDLLTALPAISYLRKTNPGIEVLLVCRASYGLLLEDAGVVDGIIPLEGRVSAVLLGGREFENPPFRHPAERVSLAVGWMQNPIDPAVGENLRRMGIPTVRFIVLQPESAVPISRFFFQETASLFPPEREGLPKFEECIRLQSGKKMMASAEMLPGFGIAIERPFAVLHPGSGGAGKCWRIDRFLEIVNRLAEEEIPGFLVTGEAEERADLSGQLEKIRLPEGWVWLRCPPLLGLAGLLSRAAFYLGNDSGVTHLAAACGTNVIALFLEKSVPAWSPYGRSRLLIAPDLIDLSQNRVWEEIQRGLPFLR